MTRTYKYGYVATRDFDYYEDSFRKGDPVPDDVFAEMWAEGGGTSNPRLDLPMKKKNG